MKIRDFEKDFENSKKLNGEWKKIIQKAFGEESNVVFNEDVISQLCFGVDVIVTTKKGRRYTVECKTRDNKYLGVNKYLLEISHDRYSDKECTNKISINPGWLYKGTFDYIFIGTLSKDEKKIIEVVGFSSIPFKLEEFELKYIDLDEASAKTEFSNGTFQITLNKKVTKEFLEKYTQRFWYWRDAL